jgi:hypothetical protein
VAGRVGRKEILLAHTGVRPQIVQLVMRCYTDYAIRVPIIARGFKVTMLPTYWQNQSDAKSFSFYARLKERQLMQIRIIQSRVETNCVSVIGNTSEKVEFKLEPSSPGKLSYFPSVFIHPL